MSHALAFLTLSVCAFSLSAADYSEDQIAAYRGGTPIPAGSHAFSFPAIAKQRITFVSEALEEIAGSVAFSGDTPLGNLSVDAEAGSGSGAISIPVAAMRTGNEVRDEHMRSESWLNAADFPTISFHDVRLQRIEATVWELAGTWTVHGVSQELRSLANVRFIPSFPHLGENVVRVKAHFDLDLKAFGLTHEAIGGPAVAQVWRVDATLLGLLQEP